MLVIRLQRTGRENLPTYRIVVSEKSAPVKSGEKEILGHFLPTREPNVLSVNKDRISHWIKMGAIPSDTVARLLKKDGMNEMEKYMHRYTKRRPKKEPPPAASPTPAPVAEAKTEEAPAPAAEEKKQEPPAPAEPQA